MTDYFKATFILLVGIFLSAAPYLPADPTPQLMVIARKKANAGGGGSPVVSFVGGNAVNESGAGITISTDTGINVQSGDVVIVVAGRVEDDPDTQSCASAPSVGTFTAVVDAVDENDYAVAVFAVVATSTQSNVIFTVTGDSQTFRAIGAAVFRTSSGSFTIGSYTSADGTDGNLIATTTARTAQDITTTVADCLLVGLGLDWNGGGTHTGANSFVNVVNGDSPFIYWRQVSSTGNYPNGNYGTVNSTDQYIGYFLEIEIE